ncbi:hypothetical protein NliqN6_3634 [Naganishia liquefaciens]|uniref:Rad4-domain-containing protein n=1 Tax=Naganishia liquefaciens TaxID=104408 RepID=A0A8H3TU61_9TREE|nr:hypothetical protein NliqN6_3634 [Naganishia liquefaciens]
MARGTGNVDPPQQLRRLGGPPRKLPPASKTASKPTAKPRSSVSSSTKPFKAGAPPVIKQDFAKAPESDDHHEVAVKRDSDGEDEDEWDEVAVADSSVVQSAPGTDYETDATGKTNGTKSDQPTGDEDVDLEAAYGYDFHDETEAQNGQDMPSKKAGGDQQADGTIEIRIGAEDGLTAEERRRRELLAQRKKPLTARDRAIRLEVHKLHVVSLLANGGLRNKWCSDDLLKARLLSLTPHSIHAAFHIPPSRIPDVVQRSRLFMTALQDLATWWANEFFTVSDWNIGIRTKSWDEVMDIVDRLPRLVRPRSEAENSKGKGKAKAGDEDDANEDFVAALGDGGERIRTVKSLMKKALQGTGGRDTSAQLFVSLCRALGLGTRLVVSLQPVQWKSDKQTTTKKASGRGSKSSAAARAQEMVANVDVEENGRAAQRELEQTSRPKAKPRRKGKMPEKTESDEEEEDDFEEVSIPTTSATSTPAKTATTRWIDTHGKNVAARERSLGIGSTASEAESDASAKTPSSKKDIGVLYRLKKAKPKPKIVETVGAPKKKKKALDLSNEPPVFWAEVYSRPDQRWIPVDPIRGTIKRKKDFEPSSDTGPIRMLYVIAFEEDGHARDVTVRYAKNFAAKTVKLRVPARKDKEDWWERILKMLQRPYRLNRDDLEDAELETSQISEGMPMVLQGFKDHPLYVLERHLKREEVIMPKKEVGKFRGEPVYRRANVVSCKTAENWMRIGRKIRPREEPLKWVKQRAVTLDRRRAQELAIQEGHEPLQQGLYAEWQTEIYRPPPIKDDIIPTNAFGNIDLYVETMLPEGAVHLPYKGIAKVAKQLGIPYAEACTGFEFKKQRAIPVITGIVVAQGQEETLMEAYWESAAAAEERALTKKQGLAIKRWQKLIQGIQIRRRLQHQYGDHEQAGPSLERAFAPPKPPIASSKFPAGPAAKASGKVRENATTNARAESSVDSNVERTKPPKEPIPEIEATEVSLDDSATQDTRKRPDQPEKVEEPETPLTELDEPVVAALRPIPKIKLKMPTKSLGDSAGAEVSEVATDEATETKDSGNEKAPAHATRPRRNASQPQTPVAARPVRSNKRARAAAQPEPAAPVTRALRSRRGDRTEEELQREREKAEAIRAALESGDEEEEEGTEESL